MTLIKLPRLVNITVSSFPASVLPKAAHRFSSWECFESSNIISGSLKKTCSHSQFSILCLYRFLLILPSSHWKPVTWSSSNTIIRNVYVRNIHVKRYFWKPSWVEIRITWCPTYNMTNCQSWGIQLKKLITWIINEIKEISAIYLDLKKAAVLSICQDKINTKAAKRETQWLIFCKTLSLPKKTGFCFLRHPKPVYHGRTTIGRSAQPVGHTIH